MKRSFYLSSLLIGCFLLLSSVVKATDFPPLITTNPTNDTVCSGTIAVFHVDGLDTTASPTAVHIRWQVSANSGSTWASLTNGGAYAGTDSTYFQVTASMSLNGRWYRAILTDSVGSDTSLYASLKVDTTLPCTISGPVAVCVGSSITLTSSVPAGVWFALNDTATVTPLGITTGVYAGLDTIVYAIYNTCPGISTDSVFLTVNALPATGTISGPATVCKASVITLTNPVAGGVWSVLHSGVDTISASGDVYAVGQGFDTIRYTTTTGLCNAFTTHAIRVDTIVIALPVTGPSVTCVGNNITLSDVNVLGTWIWSASNTHGTVYSNGVFHGNTYGIDTITYSFTNTCNSVTSTFNVQVDSLLYPGIISGPVNVCAGSLIHLTETITGGIWMSSNSLLAIVNSAGDVTGVAQGSPVISYLVSNGCGGVAATHTVNVSREASVITGGDSVGIGATLALSDSAIGGTWSVLNTSIATIGTSGVVTGVSTGTTTVSYTVTNSCGTTVATMLLHVGPTPFVSAILGVDSVCLGSTISLSDTTLGGTWHSSADTVATVSTSGVVTGVAFGAADISYSYHNAFGSTTVIKSIFVNQPPVVAVNGPNIISLGGNYFLFGYPWGGTWTASNSIMGLIVSTDNLPDTGIIIAPGDTLHHKMVTYASFVVGRHGSDTLTYTVTNSCGTRHATYVISLPDGGGVSTTEIFANDESLNVYPNPNTGEFTLNLISGKTEDVMVTISNVVGEKVRDLNIATNKQFNVKLDQPAGLYIISAVTASGAKYTSKIVVSK